MTAPVASAERTYCGALPPWSRTASCLKGPEHAPPHRTMSGETWGDEDNAGGVKAAVGFHEPVRLCVAHQQTHDCGSGFWYRCYECARTRVTPCRTWQALTGKEVPE